VTVSHLPVRQAGKYRMADVVKKNTEIMPKASLGEKLETIDQLTDKS